MDGVRAADRLRRRLREPEVRTLPAVDELGHRADRLLDRRVRVDAVLVVEVDVVDAEALQRGVASRCGRSRDEPSIVRVPSSSRTIAELRRQHDLVATTGDRAADELLVRARAVHVGGVEEVDAELERAMDRRDRLLFVRAP